MASFVSHEAVLHGFRFFTQILLSVPHGSIVVKLLLALGLLDMTRLEVFGGDRISIHLLLIDFDLAFLINLQFIHVTLSFEAQLSEKLLIFGFLI